MRTIWRIYAVHSCWPDSGITGWFLFSMGAGPAGKMHEARAVVNVRDSREMARWRITSA